MRLSRCSTARAGICRVRKKLVQNQSQRGETMTRRLVSGALVGALAAVFSAGARCANEADPKSYVPGIAPCIDRLRLLALRHGTPDNNVVKSGTYNGDAGLPAIFAGAPGTGRRAWRSSNAIPISCRSPRRSQPPPPPPPPPAAAAAAAAGPAGAEDHAGVEGAVRLRQGGAEARRQGRDRQRDHRQAGGRAEARARARHRPHRPDRLAGVQPEAVGASC